MSVNDPIGDMLTRMRNAQGRGKSKVLVPLSKMRGRVLDILVQEGYIRGYREVAQSSGFSSFEVELKYFEGSPVIREVKRVSKPGRRVYVGAQNLPTVYNGLGIAILSTSKGVLSDSQSRAQNVGGEVLCTVF